MLNVMHEEDKNDEDSEDEIEDSKMDQDIWPSRRQQPLSINK